MRRILLVALCWFFCSSVSMNNDPHAVFGVRVSIGANSSINTYVCFIDNGRTLTHKRVMDKNTFIKTITGHWPSIYNPKRVNLFEQNGIACNMQEDEITKKKVPVCIPFDSLWKIRFSVYPFRNGDGIGWSNNMSKPSLKQQKYISDRYGVDQIDGDFFLDTSFWMLMQDVMDPQWIANYKSIE